MERNNNWDWFKTKVLEDHTVRYIFWNTSLEKAEFIKLFKEVLLVVTLPYHCSSHKVQNRKLMFRACTTVVLSGIANYYMQTRCFM